MQVDDKIKPIAGTEFELDADLVLLAMGFVHPVHEGMIKALGVELDQRGNVKADTDAYQTSQPKIFAAGDMRRGQSLVVWAIREGRQCAHAIDKFLMGETQPAALSAARLMKKLERLRAVHRRSRRRAARRRLTELAPYARAAAPRPAGPARAPQQQQPRPRGWVRIFLRGRPRCFASMASSARRWSPATGSAPTAPARARGQAKSSARPAGSRHWLALDRDAVGDGVGNGLLRRRATEQAHRSSTSRRWRSAARPGPRAGAVSTAPVPSAPPERASSGSDGNGTAIGPVGVSAR